VGCALQHHPRVAARHHQPLHRPDLAAAIFRGIKVNPLAPGEIDYLLWVLLSYMVVTAVLVVTAGASPTCWTGPDVQLGFAVFTVGSILLFLTPGSGNQAALELIVFRVVQAVAVPSSSPTRRPS